MSRQHFSLPSTLLAIGLSTLLASLPAAAGQDTCQAQQPGADSMLQAGDLQTSRAVEAPAARLFELSMPQPDAELAPISDSPAAEAKSTESICESETQPAAALGGDCFITNCAASEACYFALCQNGSTGECDQTSCSHGKCIECYKHCESMC